MATKNTVKRALAEQEFSPVTTNVAGATANIDESGSLTATGGVGSEFTQPFSQFGLTQLDQAQGRAGIAPQEAAFDINSLFQGAASGQQVGQQFQGIGGDVAKAFEGFDQDAFAQQQFQRLENLAGPQNQTAANTLANRLFSSGRLGAGDTKSGAAFGELARVQANSRDQRAISALTFAGEEQGRLAQLAQSFGRTGAELTGANTNNVANIFQTLRGEDTFQQDFTGNLANQAAGSQAGAIRGTESQLASVNAAFAGADFAQGRRDSASDIQLQRTKSPSVLGGIAKGLLGAAATTFGGPIGAAAAKVVLRN